VKRLAAIDVGTNTVLLLVADVGENGRFFPVQDMERTTRIGRGLAATGRIHPESLSKTVEVIEAYLAVCQDLGVHDVHMVGTSALREAENGVDLVNIVQRRFGVTVRIISGEQEAGYAYLAAERDLGKGHPLLVVDIGGGSAEIIVGEGENIRAYHSLNVGAVGLTETFLRSDPIREDEFQSMVDHITRNLRTLAFPHPTKVVGLGGTITTLSAVHTGNECFDPARIHGSLLSRDEVRRQVLLYRGKTLAERCQIPGLPRERADIILAGAAILLEVLKIIEVEELVVSCHGLRYGLLYAAARDLCIEKSRKSC
jgi:exopolyphosphatase/guanosine-5'-triphosphate,3'-diphosphate pyrophosphatase